MNAVSRDATLMIGARARVRNADPDGIGAHWQAFFAAGTLSRIPNRSDDAMLAVYTNYESDANGLYDLIIGARVSSLESVPDGLVALSIPVANYAVFDASGPQPQAVVSAWQCVWADTGLARAYTADFDEYLGPEHVLVHVALKGEK